MQKILQPVLIWEGSYLDAWSAAHFFAGFVGAYVLKRFGLVGWRGFGAVLAAAIFWEMVEQVDGRRLLETNANSLLDIVVACAGYGIGLFALRGRSEHDQGALAVLGSFIFAGICLLRLLGA